jgi:putative oxidoreductase
MPTTTRHDLGLLLARLGIGGVLVAHGGQKLFGWFGGHGIEGTAGVLDSMGFAPGRQNAIVAGASELGGGALIVAGLAGPAAGAAVAGTMATAATVHAPNGFFAQQGGYEYPAVLGLSAAALSLAGPGRFSLDHLLGHRLNRPWMLVVGLLASVLGTTAVLNRRRQTMAGRAAAPQADAAPEPAIDLDAGAEAVVADPDGLSTQA